jgi:uncharacterized protein YeaO (DUF488 family)
MAVRLKRVYDPADGGDGYRVLVDRLWPRGVSKERAQVDLWLRDVAPSSELRTWFGHDPAKWEEFRRRYLDELRSLDEPIQALDAVVEKEPTVTLLYGAKDTEHNQAVVLAEFLASR